jgi:PRTRC genetic system protein A
VTVSMVEYLVARDGVPTRQGLAFDYLLAGDGVYLVASNDALEVRVPIAGCSVRGLPPVYPACNLKHGRLPQRIWDAIVWAAQVGYMRGHEVLVAVTFDPNVGHRLTVPPQIAGPDRVVYRPPTSAVLELHSHGPHPAVFSSTDDRDEQGLRLYGVIGRLVAERPEVALRVGAYGHFLPVLWETAFDGDRGLFRDIHFEPTPDEDSVDGIRY